MEENKRRNINQEQILTAEQENILDMYLAHLDDFSSSIKETEKIQVEIETLHLKKILAK